MAFPGRQIIERRYRFEPQVRANLAAFLLSLDFMAADAAIFADQVVAAQQLGGLVAVVRAVQISDLMMALQARRFDKARGQHRIIPQERVRIGPPVMILEPLLGFGRAVRRMERSVERGSRSLAAMARGAAELLGRMFAVGADEQVQSGMGLNSLMRESVSTSLDSLLIFKWCGSGRSRASLGLMPCSSLRCDFQPCLGSL